MKRIILFATIALLQVVAVAQTVVVPNKFAFLKSDNEYQLNILTKFLIEKQGFKAYMENEVPAELLNTPCNILRADVKNESNMMTSKLRLVLPDCANKEVFSSEVGKSREKEYKKSYQEALRNALAGNALATFRKQYQQPQSPQSSQSSVNETPEEDSIYQLNAKKVGDLYELRWRHNNELFLKARKTITPDLYIAYEVANHKFAIVQKDGSTFYRITLYTEIEGKELVVFATIKFIE